jgi:hypothetical protein
MGVVIVCLPLKDVGEGCCDGGGRPIMLGNSIDGIVLWHNPRATAAALLLWQTGMLAFILAIVGGHGKVIGEIMVMTADDSGCGPSTRPPFLLLFLAALLSMAREDGGRDGGGGGSHRTAIAGEAGGVEEGKQMRKECIHY